METMTRFGRPGRFKDFIGAAVVALAFVLLGIQTAPAAERPGDFRGPSAVTECAEVEAPAPPVEIAPLRI